MILVWSVPRDSAASAVAAALERWGADARFFDQNDALEAGLELSVDSGVKGRLQLPDGDIRLEEISGAYIRPYETSRLQTIAGAPDHARARAAALDDALLGWSEITAARVVNRPSAMASNHSKPYQSSIIHAQGFDVPETLVTTDKDALEAFWEKHQSIVYKSISGVRSIVTKVTPAHRERFATLANCPTQFQQWIPGTDFRAHVVGGEVFACRVESSATDYRYPNREEDAPKIRRRSSPPISRSGAGAWRPPWDFCWPESICATRRMSDGFASRSILRPGSHTTSRRAASRLRTGSPDYSPRLRPVVSTTSNGNTWRR